MNNLHKPLAELKRNAICALIMLIVIMAGSAIVFGLLNLFDGKL